MKNSRSHTVLSRLVTVLLILWLAACSSTPTSAPATVENPTAIPTSQLAVKDPTAIPTSQPTDEDATAVPTSPSLEQVRRPALGAPLSTFTTADFSGPSICATCHTRLTDQAGADVSMPTAWRSTMMANAAIDPVWQAKVSSEVARQPELQAVIEKKCTTCHMPMAKTQAVADGLPVTALGDGFYNVANPLHAAAIDGVSCTLCHQIANQSLGEMESFSGGYFVDTSTTPPNRPLFGPYQQPVAQQMQNQSSFTPTYGAHMISAEHCGTCHNLYTPYVDGLGNILGEFPEQTPYTEWQYSQYGAENTSCQSCHMPLAQGSVVISQTPGRLAARQPFYQHFFVGGNVFMLQILSDWGADLEVTAEQVELSNTMSRVVDQVSNKTAQLTLTSLTLEGDTLTANLQVDTLAGHKFPTSFPSRRAWLHVTVTDAAGQVIFQSGQPNADGTISGNGADFDPTAYEPHYDIITQADQVQIYEPIMGNSDGEVTYTLLRGAVYLKDNRLLPAGADKAQLPADIAVYGEAVSDGNFVGGGDLVTYQVDVTGAQGPFTIIAELLYEPLSYRFVQDLLIDETSLTARFGGYYMLADKTPLVVAAMAPSTTR